MSHPSWVCGLKQVVFVCQLIAAEVTPFVGVWIETACLSVHPYSAPVTPFVGVWIETLLFSCDRESWQGSHPSWVCGLKHYKPADEPFLAKVTPFVGVWIETFAFCMPAIRSMSHPSWVCGLKQVLVVALNCAHQVTPFVGVWIETR